MTILRAARAVARKILEVCGAYTAIERRRRALRFRIAYEDACRRGNVSLHVGAGSNRLDGWLNTDISPRAPLFLDAERPFPIKEKSVSYIFTECFIEHIPRHATLAFLEECFRVLQPGGIVRISTPDVEALARAYLDDPEQVSLLNERNRRRNGKYGSYPVDVLNKLFLEDGHACLYDAQTLQQILSEAGFRDIGKCEVGESRHTALSGIDGHDAGTFVDQFMCVVEATKPS